MTEMNITYIFVRYISVTIKRQERAFYRKNNRIFFYENQRFNKNIKLDSKEINFKSNSPRYLFTSIEEKLSYQELLYEGLNSLNDMKKQTIYEKFLKYRSDTDIGKDYSVSSQTISKRKRNTLKKLRAHFST